MVSYMQLLLIVGLVAGSAYAHRCYVCQSDGSEKHNCGEHFKSDGILEVDCSRTGMPRFLQAIIGSRNATGCMKVTTEVNNIKVISRACYFGDMQDTNRGCSQDPTLNLFNKQISCDVCAGDLCNGSTSITAMSVIALVSVYLVRHFCF